MPARRRTEAKTARTHFDPASWRFQPQWSPFLLFVVWVIVAVAVVWYMLRLFFQSGAEVVKPR